MSPVQRKKIVVLGTMSRKVVAGVVWQTLHYLLGLRRLGYDVYYVEAHGHAIGLLMRPGEEGSATAAAFIDGVMRRFDLGDRWAYHAVHTGGRCYGLSEAALKQLYDSAELIINLHGATQPLPEHSATGRLVYLETDPVLTQIELHQGVQYTIDFLEAHCAFFTFGENYGSPDCGLPVSERFDYRPTRQPVVVDLWRPFANRAGHTFSTIGSWRQLEKEATFRGEIYHWSKHYEFLKFLDLPSRTNQRFELALNRCDETDKQMLEKQGWGVRNALELSMELDPYRQYIASSRGEFTVAKDQNVRLRSGWFSDRSATYLAAGRPVITQETGFSNGLPTGQGLFAFSTMEEILQALESINSDYDRHRRAAYELAREYFSYDVVLPRLLADLSLSCSAGRARRDKMKTSEGGADQQSGNLEENLVGSTSPFPPNLVLTPTLRHPTTLAEATVKTVLANSTPISLARFDAAFKRASILIVTFNNLVYTKLCLGSLLANTEYPNYEIVVVDNGSTDGTPAYLQSLMQRHSHVRVVLNSDNLGFARANNQGLALATGDVLVLLNNDTLVPHGWLTRLVRHLENPDVGLVGPVTNRIGNEAQVDVPYHTYDGFIQFARDYSRAHKGQLFDVHTLIMFCVAMRRNVYERIGSLDEQFEIATFEDDDYAMRVRSAGYRVVCVEDVFVHHFGEASLGKLVPTGEYERLLRANRHRFEKKWGTHWEPHRHRSSQRYQHLVRRIREVVHTALPPGASVVVVSRGDDELLRLDGRRAWHFPQTEDGTYAGHYPAGDAEAIAHLESLRAKGAEFLVFPATAFWWLEHYLEFGRHLHSRYREVARREDACLIFDLREPGTDQTGTIAQRSKGARAFLRREVPE